MRVKGFIPLAITFALISFLSSPLEAVAASVPQAPGYAKAALQVIVDNDYVAFMGNATTVTRLFYQNNVPWMTQITDAASLDIYPQIGESYIYLAVMGGGGNEDWAGKLNGIDVVDIAGAQASSGRTPLGSGVASGVYMTLQGFVSGYNSTDVANGVQNVTLAQMQTALTGITWSSALSTGAGSGNIPNHKTSGVCCGPSATGSGMTGKGWNFPSDSLVVFRYPLESLGLPVRAGNTQVIVDWDAPAAGDAPTGYIVQYKKSSDPDSAYTTFASTTAPTTIATVTGLTNGINYSFRVAGTNASGTGAFSAVRDSMPVGPPPAPTSLVPTPLAGALQIGFTDPVSNGGSPITNYQYSTNSGSSWLTLSPVDTTSPIVVPGLTDGVQYSVIIRAINSFGNGDASSSVSGVPGMLARLTNVTLSTAPAKGISTVVSVSLNISSKVTFTVNGKRVAGCLKVSSSGVAPAISATCNWKPTVRGPQQITVVGTPLDSAYASGSIVSSSFIVTTRKNTR